MVYNKFEVSMKEIYRTTLLPIINYIEAHEHIQLTLLSLLLLLVTLLVKKVIFKAKVNSTNKIFNIIFFTDFSNGI